MKDFERRNQHFDHLVNQPNLRWLGQNTNHIETHPNVREAMIECIRDEAFHVYAPPIGLEELRSLVVEDLGLSNASALITDGAISGLYHLCHTLCGPEDEFITTDPTWPWPMTFASSVGSMVKQIPIYGDEYGYRLSPERLKEAVSEKTKVIYLVDPNNPLGTCCTQSEIKEITDIARSIGAYLIHDCTYRDFAYDHHLAASYYPERTITVWSFSKWLGFAGLRIGSLVAIPDIIEKLSKAPPNNLGSNIVAQRGAIAGLKIKPEWLRTVLPVTRGNQDLILQTVKTISGLRVPVSPSNGNYLIIECLEAGVTPKAICSVLAKHNIMIRHGDYHTEQFGDRFIKVSTSTPCEWVEEFCAVLPESVEQAKDIIDDGEFF
ncbi:MAG: aspartate aminotransferase [Gammaproteobacteria bacterium]|nr:aspartate aminotransferase [Gammaproteobacteria bacterium]|tara:strand:- start:7201 stop:8334 length:1134 start_codon:yes stop_codon:yes gene_type:complete